MRHLMRFLLMLLAVFFVSRPVALETLYDWQLQDARSPSEQLSLEQLAVHLADQEVVFVGEYHGHPATHLFQMRLMQALRQHRPELSLAMEQFSRDKQPVIDDYLAGKLGEASFRERGKAWPNYTSSYRPLVEFAKKHQLPVIAANAPRWLVRCIGSHGPAYLDQLNATHRDWIATELDLRDGPYKTRFMDYFASGSGKPSERLIRRYAAQVSRDETMAESIVQQLERSPERLVFVTAGNFHVAHHLGTVERVIRRRPSTRIAVISPVQQPPAQAQESASPAGDILLHINPLPPSYLASERPAHHHHPRISASCQPPALPQSAQVRSLD